MIDGSELKEKLMEYGASDVGFFIDHEADMPFPYGISIIVRLSDAVIAEIEGKPTHTYFQHYRAVNALIDNILLRGGLYLQSKGFSYIQVAASQSIPENGNKYRGRYSHKKGAYLAGMGTIGKSGLLLHRAWGPAVRLGTLFTDAPLVTANQPVPENFCKNCDRCVNACPAMAISGKEWEINGPDHEIIDAHACSVYMKAQFLHIGRGAVCGICIKECPKFMGNY